MQEEAPLLRHNVPCPFQDTARERQTQHAREAARQPTRHLRKKGRRGDHLHRTRALQLDALWIRDPVLAAYR
jgi:hypothetical protein